MGGALLVRGVILRMSPDSAGTKITMANIVASQKIDRTAALDLFILLFVLLRANVPSSRSSTETSPFIWRRSKPTKAARLSFVTRCHNRRRLRPVLSYLTRRTGRCHKTTFPQRTPPSRALRRPFGSDSTRTAANRLLPSFILSFFYQSPMAAVPIGPKPPNC